MGMFGPLIFKMLHWCHLVLDSWRIVSLSVVLVEKCLQAPKTIKLPAVKPKQQSLKDAETLCRAQGNFRNSNNSLWACHYGRPLSH